MKTKHVILIVLALITVSFFAGRWSTSAVRSSQFDEISQVRETMKVYQVELRDRDQTVYEKNQLLGTQKEAIEAGLIERDLLKALNIKKATQVTNLEVQLKAARDSIDLDGQVIFVTDTVSVDSGNVENTYVKIPFSWSHSDAYLSLQTGIRENRQGWFQLEAPAGFNIVLGGKDGKRVAAVTTPSPYITITDFNVVNLQEQNFYYKHKWIPWAGGFAVGLTSGYFIWR